VRLVDGAAPDDVAERDGRADVVDGPEVDGAAVDLLAVDGPAPDDGAELTDVPEGAGSPPPPQAASRHAARTAAAQGLIPLMRRSMRRRCTAAERP
jgi:hypothetical protein